MMFQNDNKYINIGLASPEHIRSWAERRLSSGELVGCVTKPYTIHYQTGKPEPEGLFCEKIFGPLKKGACYCGKYQGFSSFKDKLCCDECGVELNDEKGRRYNMGYVKLECPVTHVWYLKAPPNLISRLLNQSTEELTSIVYYGTFISQPLTNQPRFIVTPTIPQSNMNMFFQKNLHKFSENDQVVNFQKSLDCYPITDNWRECLYDFCSWKWFHHIESREMLSGSEALFKLLNEFDINKELEDTLQILKTLSYITLVTDKQKNQKLISPEKQQIEGPISEIEEQENDDPISEIEDTVILSQEPILIERIEEDPILDDNAILEEYENIFIDDNEDISMDNSENIDLIGQSFKAFIFSQKNIYKKRLHLIKSFSVGKNNPAWMVLFNLPVLPPDLRPIMQLKDGQFISSDFNQLYRMIISRNLAITELSFQLIHTITAIAQKILLQQAVDALLGNGIGHTLYNLNNTPYKSIPDIFGGKEGRFRQNLLGKRVDYSGRSVIVVGPSLKLNQCGLPKEMAIHLFQPFLMRSLVLKQYAYNIRVAKQMIQRRLPIIWPILKEVMENLHVFLNRAPTLHRLGIQAFQPILIPQRTIALHPLVCTGFNADFDGDQMAVHVPLSLESQSEAYLFMCPYFNLSSPATADPITIPSQDMLLGIYSMSLEANLGIGRYSTKPQNNLQIETQDIAVLDEKQEAISLLDLPCKNIHSMLWLASTSIMPTSNYSFYQVPIENQYDSKGNASCIYQYGIMYLDENRQLSNAYIRTTLGRFLLNSNIEQAIFDVKSLCL